jgi:hypothetical protein
MAPSSTDAAASGDSPILVALTAVALFALTLCWRVMTFAGFNNDHYVHLARAQQLVLGDWPVRDFADPGMPLMYMVSAAAWRLWGGLLRTELLLVAGAFALGAACTFLAARRLSRSIPIAVTVTVLEVLIAPRSYSYPKALLYPAAALAILAVVRAPSRGRLLALAGLIAVAFLFRHDHGLYIGVSAAVAVALGSYERGRTVMMHRLVTLVGGAAVFVLPWLVFVAAFQGLFDYFRSGVEFSRAEAESTNLRALPRFQLSPSEGLIRLRPPYQPLAHIEWAPGTTDATRRDLEREYRLEPVSDPDAPGWAYRAHDPSPATMRKLADDPHVSGSSGLGRVTEWSSRDGILARLSPLRAEAAPGLHTEENSYVWMFYLFHMLPLACVIVAWRRRIGRREQWAGESLAVASLSLMAVCVNVGLIRGHLTVWLPDAIAPAALLGAWLLSRAWNTEARNRSVRPIARTVAVAGLLTTMIAIANVGDVWAQIERSDIVMGAAGLKERARDLSMRMERRQRETGFAPSSVSAALIPFFDYLDRCTQPSDRVMMTGMFPDVFVMAERGFAGGHVGFLEPFYTSTLEQERTQTRLQRESVPFVLLFLDREERFRNSFQILSAHIDRRYDALADVPVDGTTRGVRIFVEKGRPVTRLDGNTDWPCFT